MSQSTIGDAGVSASLEYLLAAPERPYHFMYQPPAGAAWENADFGRVAVRIADARQLAGTSIDREGYALLAASTAVRDFQDRDEVRRVYYPEVARLALETSGASRAFVFDHLLRKREPGRPQAFGRRDGHRPGAASRVHCDFTPVSAQRRLAVELADADTPAPVARYSIVNLWRPIRHPVLDAPLALCDARTVAPADLVASDIYYPDRAGEIYQLRHNANQAWSYFPAMGLDEVLIFKQFDSADAPVARYTPHAAFDDPHAPADAPPRESIEIRCLLIFDV